VNSFSLFVPTYNVEKFVFEVLTKIPEDFWWAVTKVYVIDNGSTDQTLAEVRRFGDSFKKQKIEIHVNKNNILLGGSTVVAFDLAFRDQVDYLICMHSDSQADPKCLSTFQGFMKHDNFDFILGSRFLKESQVEKYSKIRWAANLFFAYLQQLILREKIYDLGAFIAFRMKVIGTVPYQKVPRDMGFHPYLILIASKVSNHPLKFKEFPMAWGEIKESNVNVIAYGFVHLWRILKTLLSFYPKIGGSQ